MIGSCIVFYQGVTTDHCTNVTDHVKNSRSESGYTSACTAGMALEHFIKLTNELMNNDPYVILEQAPLIILYSKSAVCMYNNGKDAKNTRIFSRRFYFVRNREERNLHKTLWC